MGAIVCISCRWEGGLHALACPVNAYRDGVIRKAIQQIKEHQQGAR